MNFQAPPTLTFDQAFAPNPTISHTGISTEAVVLIAILGIGIGLGIGYYIANRNAAAISKLKRSNFYDQSEV